jgi:hypothetical protein
MTDLALGVTVFRRTNKLRNLLESIDEQPIETVYVADQGERTAEKEELYDREYPFDLEVFDLEFNVGTGYCRWIVTEKSTEEYLLIADSDNEIPDNVEILVDQLEARPELGGVGGILAEPDRIWCASHDLREVGDVLVRGTDTDKRTQIVAGAPLVEFDVLPNITVFRRECLDDYAWDKDYPAYQHIDFYVGHKKRTDWSFGVCPKVIFEHYPGGGENYTSFRNDTQRLWNGKQMFLEKWDYRQIVLGHTTWLQTRTRPPAKGSILTDLAKGVLMELPISAQARIVDVRDRVRTLRGGKPV